MKETNIQRTNKLLTKPKTEEVLNEIIKLNFGLVRAQLNKFYLREDPEALSLAYEALFKAITTFDPEKNNKFSTYATVCIYNRLGSYIRTLNANKIELIYYEDTVLEDGSPLRDIIDSGERTDNKLLSTDHIVDINMAVNILLSEVTNNLQRSIITVWRDSGFAKTHDSIALEIGCTQSYVSQVLKKFSRKAKYKLEEIEHV